VSGAPGLSERARFGRVEVLPGPNGGRYPWSHTLLVGGTTPAVIDPGMTFDPARFDLDAAGIALVVNSHCHEDHEGGNHHFPNAQVVAPLEDAPYIRSLDAFAKAMGFDAERDAYWRKAMIEVYGFRESPVHREMRDGEVLEAGGARMRFVHLPGHTPGHSGIWFEEEDLLFVADIDLTSFGPYYGEPFADVDDFEHSIRRVREMNPRVLVTSHGRGIFEGGPMRDALDRYASKIRERDDGILKLLAAGPRTTDAIVDAHLIYRRYPEPQEVFRLNELIMIEKHLARLRAQGRIRAEDGRWTTVP
jgi:glyoxylase-like metal-dependent hydrolase (beta-lactamase superfamily II)